MLDIDTNVLVRFLVRDEPKQFERARQLIKREVGTGETALISLLVLLETEGCYAAAMVWRSRSRRGAIRVTGCDRAGG
jgi:predicted nucleic-acid-binding protein